jgi:hypothetical protein
MKTTLRLTLLMLVAMAACGGNTSTTTATDSGVSESGGPDASPDAGADAGLDSSLEAGFDAMLDSSQGDSSPAGDAEASTCGWTSYNDGLSGGLIGAVLFDTRAPGVAYATVGSSCFQSTDSGQTWALRGTLASGALGQIALLGTSASDLLSTSSIGVVVSHDAGQTWSPLGLSSLPTTSVAADPAQPLRVYAGVAGAGIFRSDDGGQTWQAVNSGYPADGYTMAIAPDPTLPDVALALTMPLNASGGWEPTASIMYTTNAGTTWQMVYQANDQAYDIQRCSSNPLIVYATGGDSVARSADGGKTWQAYPLGVNVEDVAIVPGQCDDVYVMSSNGPQYSTDGGQTVGPPLLSGLNLAPVGPTGDHLAADPSNPGGVLLGTHGGMYHSSDPGDAGVQWVVSQGILGLDARLATSPLDPSRLWLAAWGSGTWTRASSSTTWTRIPVSQIDSDYVFAAVSNPYVINEVFVGTWPNLYQSSDGMTFAVDGIQSNAFGVAFDPTSSGTAYVATQVSGVYKSMNGGATWATSNGTLVPWSTSAGTFIDVRSIIVDPNAPQTLYIGTNGQGVYKSIDGAASWTNVLAPTASVTCLALTPGTPQTLYACAGAGLQASNDSGSSWKDDSTGLPSLNVAGVVSDQLTGYLYAACGQGVFVQKGAQPWVALDPGCLPGSLAPEAPVIMTNGSQRQLAVGAGGGVYVHPL